MEMRLAKLLTYGSFNASFVHLIVCIVKVRTNEFADAAYGLPLLFFVQSLIGGS